ncbi:bifunctional DNA primase/polymerase [Streptomyces sp. NPDC058471]|uniref:bifunctional DNA primase/polymerase n=1 Tax=Streptomyces sp. NPDC058471 TaxID=3346516 RepID=UPI003668DCED
MATDVNLLGYAAQAVSRGFHIFPVEPDGKLPHLIRPDAPYRIRWSEVATSDVSRVVEWWSYSPEANIGLACKPSRLLVVDCDMPKVENQLAGTPWEFVHDKLGPLVDGSDVLREMCSKFGDDYERFERTYRVCTGSLGLHLYFWWPEGVQASQSSPVPGLVDVRCNGGNQGGYVLAAGSQTSKGPYVAENDLPIADAPSWLVELCREKPRPKPVKPRFSQPGHASYGGLVDSVRLAQEGNRSNVLLWAVRSMCEDGASQEECAELLIPAAEEAGLHQREAEATVRSGYRLQGSVG